MFYDRSIIASAEEWRGGEGAGGGRRGWGEQSVLLQLLVTNNLAIACIHQRIQTFCALFTFKSEWKFSYDH